MLYPTAEARDHGITLDDAPGEHAGRGRHVMGIQERGGYVVLRIDLALLHIALATQ
jgi:hypothetical protein